MSVFVKFIAVENKKEIGDNEAYINTIYNNLFSAGLVNSLLVAPICGKTSISPVVEIDEEGNSFRICFNGLANEKSNNWEIVFLFGTYNTSKQLQIEISSDTYSVDVKDNYLEIMKLNIKKSIVADWKDIIWLFDRDSECLSSDLYPRIYQTENILRQLINEVMSKEYGTQWWDMLVPYNIKEKHMARLKGYKSNVPAFNNVDEKLMSIDVDDLFSIITLKRKKWNPAFNEKISQMLNGMLKCQENVIIDTLKNQMEIELDLWDSQFSNYLSVNFIKNFKEFELNRNHIAHNKLIDRSAYNTIKISIELIYNDVKDALQTVTQRLLSKEEQDFLRQKQEEEIRVYFEMEHDRKESDANISIRSNEEIMDLFDEKIAHFMTGLSESLHFRNDIEISDNNFMVSEYEGTFFTVRSKVNKESIEFKYSIEVYSDEGGETIMTVWDDNGEFKSSVSYLNGAVIYDEELGIYMPYTEDGISEKDFDDLQVSIIEYIIENLPDVKEQVQLSMYSIIKDGGNSPIAEGVFCSECWDEWICVDEEFAPYGTCLNCGYINEIAECYRCGALFNADWDGRSDGEVSFCQNCLDDFERE